MTGKRAKSTSKREDSGEQEKGVRTWFHGIAKHLLW